MDNQECEVSSSEFETILSSGNFLRDTSFDFDSLIAIEERTDPEMSHRNAHERGFSVVSNSETGDAAVPPFLIDNGTQLSLKTVISMCKKPSSTSGNKNRIASSLLRVKAAHSQTPLGYNCDFCEFSRRSFPTFENLQKHWLETHNFQKKPLQHHNKSSASKQLKTSGVAALKRSKNNSCCAQFGFGVNNISEERNDIESEDEIEEFMRRAESSCFSSQGGFLEETRGTDSNVGKSVEDFVESGIEEVVASLQSISCPVCLGVFATGKLLNKHVREVHLIEF